MAKKKKKKIQNLDLRICHYTLGYIQGRSNWFALQFLRMGMVHWMNMVQVEIKPPFFFFLPFIIIRFTVYLQYHQKKFRKNNFPVFDIFLSEKLTNAQWYNRKA